MTSVTTEAFLPPNSTDSNHCGLQCSDMKSTVADKWLPMATCLSHNQLPCIEDLRSEVGVWWSHYSTHHLASRHLSVSQLSKSVLLSWSANLWGTVRRCRSQTLPQDSQPSWISISINFSHHLHRYHKTMSSVRLRKLPEWT